MGTWHVCSFPGSGGQRVLGSREKHVMSLAGLLGHVLLSIGPLGCSPSSVLTARGTTVHSLHLFRSQWKASIFVQNRCLLLVPIMKMKNKRVIQGFFQSWICCDMRNHITAQWVQDHLPYLPRWARVRNGTGGKKSAD